MSVLASALLILQAGSPAVSLNAYFTESIFPGRVLGAETAIGLCAETEADAAEAMQKIVKISAAHGEYNGKICTFPIIEKWSVVRKITDLCEKSKEGEWCAIEAHVVLAEKDGKQRYALVLVKDDQLN